ncbi:MAG: winged helix-turn-helix domain-containing protein [Deltaproteobacteria bacterium]|nr:winged helix-turn-helix domain-containing protein [Deltaproteobacteria bacterium]
MGEIDRTDNLSQRDLSRRLNISLGLVNTFIKRLVNKGYFKVTTMPRNRVKYFRLTVEYLRYSVDSYKDIKNLLLNKYREMERNDVRSVLFYGAGEVAELAYLYLQLTKIRLAGIIDDKRNGNQFFEFNIAGPDSIHQIDWDLILLTRLEDTDRDIATIVEMGVDPERVAAI